MDSTNSAVTTPRAFTDLSVEEMWAIEEWCSRLRAQYNTFSDAGANPSKALEEIDWGTWPLPVPEWVEKVDVQPGGFMEVCVWFSGAAIVCESGSAQAEWYAFVDFSEVVDNPRAVFEGPELHVRVTTEDMTVGQANAFSDAVRLAAIQMNAIGQSQ